MVRESNGRRIAILGTGATGSVYAGLLGTAGHDVWAIDVWPEHIEAIRAGGLRVTGASGDRVAMISATTDPSEVGPVDLVVIATKAGDVELAARSALSLLGERTVVLPIQNGLGSRDRVAAIVGEDRVITGVIGGFGASMLKPGHVHHHGMELVRLGELRGPVSERVEDIGRLWHEAGFTVRTYSDVGTLVWEKLVCNVAFSGTCAATRLTIGEVLEGADAWPVAGACATEAYEVARSMGVSLGFDDPVGYVREFGSTIPGARPSMLLDLLAGRRTEVDVINGAITRLGSSAGVRTPVNDTVTALVHVAERMGQTRTPW
jgi:2-dehydropantoate 2-reductase